MNKDNTTINTSSEQYASEGYKSKNSYTQKILIAVFSLLLAFAIWFFAEWRINGEIIEKDIIFSFELEDAQPNEKLVIMIKSKGETEFREVSNTILLLTCYGKKSSLENTPYFTYTVKRENLKPGTPTAIERKQHLDDDGKHDFIFDDEIAIILITDDSDTGK